MEEGAVFVRSQGPRASLSAMGRSRSERWHNEAGRYRERCSRVMHDPYGQSAGRYHLQDACREPMDIMGHIIGRVDRSTAASNDGSGHLRQSVVLLGGTVDSSSELCHTRSLCSL